MEPPVASLMAVGASPNKSLHTKTAWGNLWSNASEHRNLWALFFWSDEHEHPPTLAGAYLRQRS